MRARPAARKPATDAYDVAAIGRWLRRAATRTQGRHNSQRLMREA
jgi:hypothetical protein